MKQDPALTRKITDIIKEISDLQARSPFWSRSKLIDWMTLTETERKP